MGSSSISSSEPRRFPRAALLAATVVIAGETMVGVTLPQNQGRHEVDTLLARIDTVPAARDAVVLGDSVTLRALDGTAAAGVVEDLTTNMAVGVPGNVCIARRILRRSPSVRDLFLVFIPETWEYDMDTERAMSYFETCFLRWDEVGLLIRTRGWTRQTLRVLRNRLFWPPSFRARGEVLARIPFLANRRIPDTPKRFPWLPQVLAARLAQRRGLNGFRASPLAQTYLQSLLEEFQRSGRKVTLVTAALPREVAEAWRGNGRLARYEEFLASLRVRWPCVSAFTVDAFADEPESRYYDPVHLQPGPQGRYGTRLSEAILTSLGRK